MTQRHRWHAVAAAGLLLATPSVAEIAPSLLQLPSEMSRGFSTPGSAVIRIANETDEVKPESISMR